MTGRGGRPRPTKAAGPVLGSVLLLVAWTAVAHNSGSGWVQALGCLLAGFVVVGLVGPALAAARLGVVVVSNPTDAVLGRPVVLEVHTGRPARVQGVAPAGPPAVMAAGGGVEVVPTRRGPLTEVALEVASAAPFGLLWWSKRAVVTLARPLWVAPAPGPADPALVAGATAGAVVERGHPRDARFGEPRGVRPYEAGDPRRLVHWPATAHHGGLMVREAERADAAVPEVVVSLPDDGPAGDTVAGRALGTVLALLARSSPVMLSTLEPEGPVRAAVFGPADAGRRLARAVAARSAR